MSTRVKGRSAADAQSRRDRVIEVARQLAEDGGPDAVQIRTVAKLAEVSIVTLYRIVPSKNALLILVAADQVKRIWEHNEKHPIVGGTRGERVARIFKRAFRVAQQRPKLGHAIFTVIGGASAIAEYSPDSPPLIEEPIKVLTDVAQKALETDGSPATEREQRLIQMAHLVWVGSLGQCLSGTMSAELALEMIDLACAQIDLDPHE